MIKIIINGYLGKMGQTLARLIDQEEDMKVVCGVDANLTSVEETGSIALLPAISDYTGEADVIIDFSYHTAVKGVLDYAKERHIPAVICTTGLTDEEIDYLEKASEKVGVFRSANMSLGINLMARALQMMSPALEKDFDIEIVEMHHNMKKDAPSGTAILLADRINQALAEEKEYIHGRQGDNVPFSKKEMGIHALRGGTIAGEHTVRFSGPDEVIEIRHLALSREIFAHGAIAAAGYMADKGPGLYSMDNLLDETL